MKSYLRYRVLVILAVAMASPMLGDSIDQHKDRLAADAKAPVSKMVRTCSCHGVDTGPGTEELVAQPAPPRRPRELRDR